jgi:hypothetical protein
MTFGEVIGVIAKKLLVAIAKVLVFLIWTITSAIEVLLRELNTAMREYLFNKH